MTNPTVPLNQPLLDAQDLAKLLRVKKSWVYRESREGRLPTIQLGRYRLFSRASIEEWLAIQQSSSYAPPAATGRD